MEQQPSSPPPVSVVVGAGPAGILSAVLLARRGHEVHLLDKRPSPLEQDASDQHRAFFVVLHARGAAALAAAGFDLAAAAAEPGSGLQAVRAIGMGRGAALHQRRVAFQTPRILGPRHAFVRAMVAQAQGMGLPNLHLHWGAAFDSLDLASKTATFRRCSPFCSGPGSPSGGGGHAMHDGSGDGAPASGSGGCGGCNGGAAGAFTLAYDLLVAADGGWSRVRGAAAAQAPELQASVQPADAHYKVFRRLPASLLAPLGAADGGSGSASTGGSVPDVGSQADIDAGDGVQLRFVLGSGAGGFRPAAVMFLAAEPGEPGAVRGMLSIASQQAWEGLQEAGQAEAFLAAQFPALPPEWIPQIAAQLAEAPLAMAGMRVRCSQLHAPSLVLVGDAAHGVTPRTGNGMNASLESAWVLDQVLEGCGGDLDALPAAYTAARLADARGLLWLDQTAAARAGTSPWGRLHPLAWGATASLLWRALLGKATGGWVQSAPQVSMNEGCEPYSRVKARMQRDNLLLATVGLPAAAPVALLSAAAAGVDRMRA